MLRASAPFKTLAATTQRGRVASRALGRCGPLSAPATPLVVARGLSGGAEHTHFRASGIPHPLKAKPKAFFESLDKSELDAKLGDHTGRQQNHIWLPSEIAEIRANMYRHKPVTLMDKGVNAFMYSLYHVFNFISGYREKDPTASAIEWRLIVLESVAGVPGFVAAAFRHFKSLRTLQRDHGWILTLLEEAENERMHLLVCLNMFNANIPTRLLVLTAQMVMTPLLIATYIVQPKAMHRFVGYLEETAVHTYNNVITHIETPGTILHKEWSGLKAPPMAIGYWRLPADASWCDALKCMMADEANHRDVNHTFATLAADDPNPFVFKHKEDAVRAWRLENGGANAWEDESLKAMSTSTSIGTVTATATAAAAAKGMKA